MSDSVDEGIALIDFDEGPRANRRLALFPHGNSKRGSYGCRGRRRPLGSHQGRCRASARGVNVVSQFGRLHLRVGHRR